MVTLTDPLWLKRSFDTLNIFFYRVVIWKNDGKMVGMICRPFRVAGTQLNVVY